MAADVYEVRLYYTAQSGKRWENVLHLAVQTPFTSADPFINAGLLLAAFQAANETVIVAPMATDCNLAVYTSRRINNGGGPTNSLLSGAGGGSSSESSTASIAVNLCWIPGAPPYQRKEGHTYLAGVPSNAVLEDIIQSSYMTQYQAIAEALQEHVIGGGGTVQLCIYDRDTDVVTPVADIVVRTNVTPMRRRLKPKIA